MTESLTFVFYATTIFHKYHKENAQRKFLIYRIRITYRFNCFELGCASLIFRVNADGFGGYWSMRTTLFGRWDWLLSRVLLAIDIGILSHFRILLLSPNCASLRLSMIVGKFLFTVNFCVFLSDASCNNLVECTIFANAASVISCSWPGNFVPISGCNVILFLQSFVIAMDNIVDLLGNFLDAHLSEVGFLERISWGWLVRHISQ